MTYDSDTQLKKEILRLIRVHHKKSGKVMNSFRIYINPAQLKKGQLEIKGFQITYKHNGQSYRS